MSINFSVFLSDLLFTWRGCVIPCRLESWELPVNHYYPHPAVVLMTVICHPCLLLLPPFAIQFNLPFIRQPY